MVFARSLVVAFALAACNAVGTPQSLPHDDDPVDAGVDPDASEAPPHDAEPLGEPADAEVPELVEPDGGVPCVLAATTSGFHAITCGTLARPRWGHEAALLPDGRVVILGGWDTPDVPWNPEKILDVEVFDPATETFAVVAQLVRPRVAHRATSLADGRVLVTGGQSDDGWATATTEIFDPATDSITPGPNMTMPRLAHTATLLADGRVLITGGETNQDPDPDSDGVAIAEVYDPATNTFAVVGPMTAERHAHEAVLLDDGRVLITGGADAPSCCEDGISSAELFDPATGTFSATSRLVTARPEHRITRLRDGSVLVTGGSIANGGASGPEYLRAVERYQPTGGTFASSGEMTTAPGTSYTATRLDTGDVLIAGGLLGDSAEQFDPATGTFTSVASHMTADRASHTATLLASGAVLLVGGRDLATAELYIP